RKMASDPVCLHTGRDVRRQLHVSAAPESISPFRVGIKRRRGTRVARANMRKSDQWMSEERNAIDAPVRELGTEEVRVSATVELDSLDRAVRVVTAEIHHSTKPSSLIFRDR